MTLTPYQQAIRMNRQTPDISIAEALRLAMAIQRGRDLDLVVHIQDDDEPWEHDCPRPRFQLYMYVTEGNDDYHLAGLRSIGCECIDDPILEQLEGELMITALERLAHRRVA